MPNTLETHPEILPQKQTSTARRGPKILFVTPEISYVSNSMCNDAQRVRAKAGGLADVAALLVDGLKKRHRDLHLALPNYRQLFRTENGGTLTESKRVHLAEDCHFYRRHGVYQTSRHDLLRSALAFQREVIHRIIPKVKPDIIHCNDWMTGLIPAAAKRLGIPTLFTIHNIHTERPTLAELENNGVFGADFWEELYFENYPENYDESYWTNPIDLLASGIRAADHVNVVSPTFLDEIRYGHHENIPGRISHLLWEKHAVGAASGIVNSPDPSFNPQKDSLLTERYKSKTHHEAKAVNKLALQHTLGLDENPDVPMLFWPSRLDPIQKGPQLLAEILPQLIQDYHDIGLQIAIIADGPWEQGLHDIVNAHGLHRRVAVHGFSEPLSRQGFGGADYVLMPSSFEPCGLPQMIGARYGTLPIVHHTGGLKDTVQHLNIEENTGNGFAFEHFDAGGLRWAIDEALRFHLSDESIRIKQVTRIMEEAARNFSPVEVVKQYEDLYTGLVPSFMGEARA